jgi:hypothetical protein
MEPAEIRERLAAARRRGEPFEEAWRSLMPVTVDLRGRRRQPWGDETTGRLMTATKSAWRRAYLRQPPTNGELAVVRLLAVVGESLDARRPRTH